MIKKIIVMLFWSGFIASGLLLSDLFFSLFLPFVIGSIPFGYLLTRLAGAGDIRHQGSGNIGATNVLRTGKKGIAALTLFLDTAKGALYCLYAKEAEFSVLILLCGAFCVVLGHVFSVFLQFKGGKGVATAIGTYCVICPEFALVALVVWGGVAKLFKISSLSALVASLVTCILSWLGYVLYPSQGVDIEAVLSIAIYVTSITCLLVYTHKDNIDRLMHGSENKITIN